ncbi:MAG: amidohydrolase family protein [Syntrophomonas sp.]
MIIDGHSHLTFPIEEHIRVMDQADVSKTVLFSTTFHPEAADNYQDVKESMQYLNDLLAGKKGTMVEARQRAIADLLDAIKLHPDRYIGFGSTPAGLDVESTRQYIDDNIRKHHLAGIGEFTIGGGQAHLMKNVFEAAAEFDNLPIWIHAFFPLTLQDIMDISVMAREHPRTPVILGHLGGCNWMETMDLATEIANIYLDTSAYYSTFILGTVINELPEKCIFGVDRPFGDLELSIQAVLKLAKTPAVANAVLGRNIARILNI